MTRFLVADLCGLVRRHGAVQAGCALVAEVAQLRISVRTFAMFITEIFKSIQGEGTRAGLPCIFVRLTGCNLALHLVRHRLRLSRRQEE